MVGWLKLILIAAAVMIGLWGLLISLAARLPAGLLKDLAGFLPACTTSSWPAAPCSTASSKPPWMSSSSPPIPSSASAHLDT
jgi:hypothetical protein